MAELGDHMRKLTPTVVAETRRLSAEEHLTQAEISRRVKVSRGSVQNALAAVHAPRRSPAPLAPPEPAAAELEAEALDEPADLDAQLAWLSRVAAQRRQDADRLRRQGDDAGAARATADALKAAALLARHTTRPEQAGRYVTDEQIAQAADECRSRLRALVERAALGKVSP